MHRILGVSALLALLAAPLAAQTVRGRVLDACLPRLFVDGTRVTYDFQNDIDSVVSPNQVEALEIFRGPSEIPPQYNDNNSMCGVVLIWTRTDPHRAVIDPHSRGPRE
jgi:hypothetical protein